MAQISLEELVQVLREHPLYADRWERGVGAETALYIALRRPAADESVESESYDGADGSLVVLDRDSRGFVRGIEIT